MKKDLKVSVIGLGYIGLPTAAIIASKGYQVVGIDVNQSIIDTINEGRIHIKEPALAGLVKHDVDQGLLKATMQVEKADVFLVTVPTPINDDKSADLGYVNNAITTILPALEKGNLVIIESTCPVGTTENLYQEIINERPELENEIFMAYCPERVLPGNIIYELEYNDRVIGGITEESTAKAINFYHRFVKGQLLETNARSAEMCKLTENAYRDVNIAFANELSMICEEADIDPYELIKLANHHPRVNILQPGPGVGGHCIAVDPWFLITEFNNNSDLMRTARETNLRKTEWVIEAIENAVETFEMNKGRKPVLACMGLAFKPNVDDLRESPSLYIYETLKDKGFTTLACEPNLNDNSGYPSLTSIDQTIKKADIFIFLVAHTEFKSLTIPVEKEILKFCNL